MSKLAAFLKLIIDNPCLPYILISFAIWIFLVIKYRSIIANDIKYTFKREGEDLIVKPETLIFFLYLACYGFYLPLSFDEAYSFRNFINKNIFYAVFTYPAPNNHVFHSILANLNWHVFSWTKSELLVRLPAIFASVLSLQILMHQFRPKSKLISLLCFLIVVLNFQFLSFSFQARGYSLQVLFALVSVIIITDIKGSHRSYQNDLFLFCSLLGLYTSPSYLYVFIPLLFIHLVQNKTWILAHVKHFIISGLLFGTSVILLYAPIILFSGIEALTSNKYVAPQGHLKTQDILNHFYLSIVETCGGLYIGNVVLLLFIIAVLYSKKYSFLFLLIIPFLQMIVLKQTPYMRVFLPLAVSIIYLTFHISVSFTEKFKIDTNNYIYYVFILTGCLASAFFYQFYKQKDDLNSSYSLNTVKKYLNAGNIYVDNSISGYFKASIRGYMELKKKNYTYFNDVAEVPVNHYILSISKSSKSILIDSTILQNEKVFVETKTQ